MSKEVPRAFTTIRMKVHIMEMLKQGAAYHGIKYQTYLQWLLEDTLKAEARYYGWVMPSPVYKVQKEPTEARKREISRLMRIAKRRAKLAKVAG